MIMDMITTHNKNFTSNEYYSNTYMMSHFPKYWYFVTIGSRGRGKTYSGKNYAIKTILDQWENPTIRRFMWWRLTNDAVSKVLENNGSTFFEKSLLEKHDIIVNVINSDLYFAKRSDYDVEVKWNDEDDEKGKTETISIQKAKLYKDELTIKSEPIYKWKHVGKVASIQEYYKYKGNQLNDYDLIIMDELVRAE